MTDMTPEQAFQNLIDRATERFANKDRLTDFDASFVTNWINQARFIGQQEGMDKMRTIYK